MLTAKQEAFAVNIVEGMNQADAYRSAYSAKNMSDNAIYREASLLVSNPKIAQRIAELREELSKPTIMTAQKRLEWLTELINSEEDVNAKLKAIDIMNKMQGEYTQKIEADVKSEVTINVELVDEE
jgi:phage terminase small subunit